jgi:hypothetical protein
MNRLRRSRNYAAFVLSALVLSLLICQSAFAQTGTSSVRGTVADPQGNVIAGASVTLTSTGTNAARTQVTNENGVFAFELIPPGEYRLEVEAQGFKKAQVSDVRALVSKPTETNVQLEIGNVTEVVTVALGTSDALLNNQDATLGNNFVKQQITQLPLEARDVTALLTLQPGVTREGYVNGSRSDQANVTLDGVDINEAQSNRPGGPTGVGGSNALDNQDESPDRNTVLRLNSEAIDEFRVTTTNPNASQGRSSGAQISLITKSGSNSFHGALFEFHRNTIFTANDFFNNRNGRFVATDTDVITGQAKIGDLRNPRPKLLRNTFGGELDGPIIKDRFFFLYSYEGRRDAKETVIVQRVPLPSLGRGEVRYVNPSGGVTTVTAAQLATIFPELGGVNPLAVSALAAAAAKYTANDFTVGDSKPGQLLNTAGFRFNAPTPVNLNSNAIRLDYNLTSKQQLFARGNAQYDLFGGTRAFPDTPSQDTWSHPWGFVIGHTWTISNKFVNSFRYGLTREAFTTQGDAAKNEIYFRNVFFPVNDSRTLSRTTPVQNYTDDFSWLMGNHTAQFGTNIRLTHNRRVSYANAYDSAVTNPSFYENSGTPISDAINAFSPVSTASLTNVRNATTALLGRLSDYTARFTFDKQGNLLPPGTPAERDFVSQEFDFYGQDIWKIRSNLTLTYGLRYSLSRPVFEANGFEAKPNIPLSEYFQRRIEGAAAGVPYNEPISVELSGPANGKSPLYHWDKNNFQPRIAIAWSPNYKSGFLSKIFGKESQTVLRGGFAITNDYYGQQLAVSFDTNNSLGFSSSTSVSAQTYNVSDSPAPLFTGFSQGVRNLPGLIIPTSLTFPQSVPADNQKRIEASVDEALVAPIHYSWNATFERSLPHGLFVQASYVGRAARNLLVTRDIMALNNLVDTKSGTDWYTAAGMLEDIRHQFAVQGITSSSSRAEQQAAIRTVAPIPYFENLFGSVPGFARALLGSSRASFATNATQAVLGDALIFNGNDWTTTQADIDGALPSNVFYQPQYGALAAFSSVGRSNYNAGTISVRERLGQKLTLDFNYTLSHSLDDASGLQTSSSYGTAFIVNPIRQQDSYANSDFDVRHVINLNAVWQLPFGHGQWLLNNNNKLLNGFLGGWQLSAIYRWNSGLPVYSPYDDGRWATNWEIESGGVRIRPVEACATRGDVDPPKLFGCNVTAAYQSWRNPKPGETGDRNVIRLPGYVNLDMGLSKSFTMPWKENHQLQIRVEAFNVTNTQRMGNVNSGTTGLGLVLDPQLGTPPSEWSNFRSIQGAPRVVQFGFRYSF